MVGVSAFVKWDWERILAALESLLQTRGVAVESPPLIQAAIDAAREGHGSFPDHLIAQVGFANGATEILTFDPKFAKTRRVKHLK